MARKPPVTICVLTFGNHAPLTRQAIASILQHCPQPDYRLVVGANAVSPETLQYLSELESAKAIENLIVSEVNISKCPLMRRMFEHVETDYIWWFDDDSYVTSAEAFQRWVGTAEAAPEKTVMWGTVAVCDHPSAFASNCPDVLAFVRAAPWYRGLPPPSWQVGGKGEFDFEGRGTGDGRWFFILGGCWLIRTRAVRALDWPDRRLVITGDDVFLGEAIRQQGWRIEHIESPAVAVDTAPRRRDPGRHAGEFGTRVEGAERG
jgi:GT2 family glycosyltransferase